MPQPKSSGTQPLTKHKAAAAGALRAEGKPVLGITASPESPWTAAAGADAELRLSVSNRGGPISGIYLELGGDAVAQGLIAGLSASIGDAGPIELDGKGQTFRADLAHVELEAGLADPKEARAIGHPSLELVVRVRGQRAGAAFMTVRVGPLSASGTSGSALQGRSFVVSEA